MAGNWPRFLVACVLVAASATGCGRKADVSKASADVPAENAGVAAKAPRDEKEPSTGSVSTAPGRKGGVQSRPAAKPQGTGPGGTSRPASDAPAAAAPLLAEVTDPVGDREGAAETSEYVDLTAASVERKGRDLLLTVTAAAPIPGTPEGPNDLALYAFDIETDATQWSLTAQITEDGAKAELSDGEARQPVDFEMTGPSIRFVIPWDLLGPGQPDLSWTASSAYLTFHGGVASAKGGDAAPSEPASFPPGRD